MRRADAANDGQIQNCFAFYQIESFEDPQPFQFAFVPNALIELNRQLPIRAFNYVNSVFHYINLAGKITLFNDH